MVRHGQSTYNVEQRVQGHCDESILTEAGRTGALQVGEALSGLQFDAIYTSPLKRARATADLIVSKLPAHSSNGSKAEVVDLLKEISLPPWEGMRFQEIQAAFPAQYQLWRDRPQELCFQINGSDGPTDFFPIPSLYEQASQFWQMALPGNQGKTLLVVAHSAINRALISTAIGLEPERFISLYQSNCGISILNFANGWGSLAQLESLNLTAHLGEPLPKGRRGDRGARILLVRHGETEWNRQQKFQGQIDVPLNETGRAQGQQAAEFLKSVPLDQAFTSPLLRPKETAELILKSHPTISLQLIDELQEISHGEWEGKLEAEIEQAYPGDLQRWQQAPETVQMPAGENLQQVWERAIAAWQIIIDSAARLKPESTVLVVAHDAINKAILCHVAGLGPEHFWTFKQGNGAVSVIAYPHSSKRKPPVMQAVNITTHLAGGILDKTAAGAL
ncbi:MAG: histidine phosphatase family protein [Cyanothece sp. SIO1E1]|nr:histidine phosphatase family protein [Cyanothece sp. SIO1E1]